MSVLSPTDKLIRKLRKKLRQIENLEFLGRSNLNEEELLKVNTLSFMVSGLILTLSFTMKG